MQLHIRLLFLIFLVLSAGNCSASPANVLVVENSLSTDSIAIAQRYIAQRHVPVANLCKIKCTTLETVSTRDAVFTILTPVRQYIQTHHLKIDYIVLTKGIPIYFDSGTWKDCSIDSVMVELDDPVGVESQNPYFAATDRFSHAEYGIYLVTRLTGWTVTDCYRLIDSGQATTPAAGPIYLHPAPGHDTDGNADANQAIRIAWAELSASGYNVDLDSSDYFHNTTQPMMGYYSWGSNDPNFDKGLYDSMKFARGSIAETIVSTSARTFYDPRAPGQSLIADLVHEGVAGCKGYVTEPYVAAMAVANILFDRYTSGWNLADSFYASSRIVCWKDIVIGDPLCQPYGNAKHKKP